jgi:hypothetical protein
VLLDGSASKVLPERFNARVAGPRRSAGQQQDQKILANPGPPSRPS